MSDDIVQPLQGNQSNDLTQDLEEKLDRVAEQTMQKVHQDPVFSQSLALTPQMQDVVVEVEEDLLREIITRLEKRTLSVEKAQSLAKEFLSCLPIQDQKDLLEKLRALSKINSEVSGVYLKYEVIYEEQERHKKLDLMSRHIHQGDVEGALAVAKGRE